MATIKKITSEEFKKIVFKEVKEMKRELYKEEKNIADSNKAIVYKDKKTTETKKGKSSSTVPFEVEINSNSKDQGSDKKGYAIVGVKSGSEKSKKGVSAGQHNAEFKSKKDNPSKESSQPFVKKSNEEINSMDGLTDEETKTYVDAGSKIEKDGTTKGQYKAITKEKAPIVKDKEPIIKGIETEQGNSNQQGKQDDVKKELFKINLKENYTRKELIEKIKTEAQNIAREQLLKQR